MLAKAIIKTMNLKFTRKHKIAGLVLMGTRIVNNQIRDFHWSINTICRTFSDFGSKLEIVSIRYSEKKEKETVVAILVPLNIHVYDTVLLSVK